jgi:hypothetical protein
MATSITATKQNEIFPEVNLVDGVEEVVTVTLGGPIGNGAKVDGRIGILCTADCYVKNVASGAKFLVPARAFFALRLTAAVTSFVVVTDGTDGTLYLMEAN